MKNLNFKHISNLSEAQKIWKEFSPNKVLYDDWDFRYSYYKYFNYPLDFILGYDGSEAIGVLPLMFDSSKGYLDFFAGFGYMEDNAVFLKAGYEEYSKEFVKQIEKPALLEYMSESMNFEPARIHDYNYYIELTGMKNYEDFVSAYLSPDGKRNLLSQVRKITAQEIKISFDNIDDMTVLEHWNRVRFTDHSSFAERPHWQEFFREIALNFPSKIITVEMNGEKEGVGFVLFYKDICYGINAGYNPEIKNLGKYLTLLKIESAISSGMRIYDAGGSGAFGWKEDFHLKKRPFFEIDLKKT